MFTPAHQGARDCVSWDNLAFFRCGINFAASRQKTNTMKVTVLSFTLALGLSLSGQAQHQELSKTILSLDSTFWQAYNNCDVETMEKFFTNDLEFYHDKGGLTEGASALFGNVRKGLCGNENFRLRRVAIPGTMKVYPLENYGAILSGEHLFYINETGKEERLDGIARFTHVWKYADGKWKMHRVLSYDHGPAQERIREYPQLRHLWSKGK